MSFRYGSGINKPGFNALAAQTTTIVYNLFSWGSNTTFGQLGLGNTTSYSSPKQVGALTTWLTVAAGYAHVVATKSDGTLWTWGYNANGQLGLGNVTYYSSPKQVGALTTWSKIAAARLATFSIKTDGTLWSWGYNATGQLGDGTATNRSSPVQVGALTTWLTVAAGSYHTIATQTNGTLWTWGYNANGQLGLGTSGGGTQRSSPVQVGLLTTWLNIAGGGYNTLAVKTDGTLWSWGYNAQGQLGLGNTTDYSSPKQVGALTAWLKVASGLYHSIVTKTDGTLWAWGQGGSGQLGLGNLTYYSSPKQVGGLTTWATPSVMQGNTRSSMAIKTDGTLWTWGFNGNGRLGLGNTTNYSSPKQVGAGTTWIAAARGQDFTVAIG